MDDKNWKISESISYIIRLVLTWVLLDDFELVLFNYLSFCFIMRYMMKY